MKTFLTLIFLCVMAKTFAQHRWFPAESYVWVHPRYISVDVYNNYSSPIYCTGLLMGITQRGERGTIPFRGWVVAGQSARGYLQAWGDRYFMNGSAFIYCRF